MSQLHQSLRALDGQLSNNRVIGRRAVEGRGNNLTLDEPLHVGHFFGTLVHEDHHEVDLGVVDRDRVGDLLHDDRLASLGRGDDEATLALADRSHQVNDARGKRLRRCLHAQHVLRVERRHLVELGTLGQRLEIKAVDGLNFDKRVELVTLAAAVVPPAAVVLLLGVVLLGLAEVAYSTHHSVAAAQAMTLNHLLRYVGIVGAGQVAGSTHVCVLAVNIEDARYLEQNVVLARSIVFVATLVAILVPVIALVAVLIAIALLVAVLTVTGVPLAAPVVAVTSVVAVVAAVVVVIRIIGAIVALIAIVIGIVVPIVALVAIAAVSRIAFALAVCRATRCGLTQGVQGGLLVLGESQLVRVRVAVIALGALTAIVALVRPFALVGPFALLTRFALRRFCRLGLLARRLRASGASITDGSNVVISACLGWHRQPHSSRSFLQFR